MIPHVFGSVARKYMILILGCGMTGPFMTTQIGIKGNQIITKVPQIHNVFAIGKDVINGVTGLAEVGIRSFAKSSAFSLSPPPFD